MEVKPKVSSPETLVIVSNYVITFKSKAKCFKMKMNKKKPMRHKIQTCFYERVHILFVSCTRMHMLEHTNDKIHATSVKLFH